MEVSEERKGSLLVLHIGGRIDLKASHDLANLLTAVLGPDVKNLILDLSATEYISSSGLKSLLQARRKLREGEGDVVLCGQNPHVRKTLTMVGFGQLFSMADSEAEAMEILGY